MLEQDKHETINSEQPGGSRFPFPFLVAAAAAVIILAGVFAWPGRQSPPTHTGQVAHLPFGPEEQAYASKIRLENLSMSRAENFLQQEVTMVNGEVVNDGDRALENVEITIEFGDEQQQLVLREARLALGAAAPPIKPRERRDWEASFEHIPSSWNMRQPYVRVTGLRFAAQ